MKKCAFYKKQFSLDFKSASNVNDILLKATHKKNNASEC